MARNRQCYIENVRAVLEVDVEENLDSLADQIVTNCISKYGATVR